MPKALKFHHLLTKNNFPAFCLAIITFCSCVPDSGSTEAQYTALSDSSLTAKVFRQKEIPYPPDSLVVLLFKNDAVAEIWTSKNGRYYFIENAGIEAEILTTGPRLYNQSDRFPEGIYRISGKFIKNEKPEIFIGFPNSYEKAKAKADHRKIEEEKLRLGKSGDLRTEIFLKDEHLILLTETVRAGIPALLLSFPSDPRPGTEFIACIHCPEWYVELYSMLGEVIRNFVKPRKAQ